MVRYVKFGLVVLAIFLFFARSPNSKTAQPFVAAPAGLTLIAHAGSGMPQGTYPNSIQAMDLAVSNGIDLIEIDLSWTADRQLVAIHDWTDSYFNWFNMPLLQQLKYRLRLSPSIPDLATFNAMTMRYDQEQADLAGVMRWLQDHPEVQIVTDVKDSNLTALQMIADDYAGLIPQIIPQIYAPEEYGPVVAMGWVQVIFTAYRSDLSITELGDFAQTHPLFALTIPPEMLVDGQFRTLIASQTPVFTHTINDVSTAAVLDNEGFAGLYTDYLLPPQ